MDNDDFRYKMALHAAAGRALRIQAGTWEPDPESIDFEGIAWQAFKSNLRGKAHIQNASLAAYDAVFALSKNSKQANACTNAARKRYRSEQRKANRARKEQE